MSTMIEKRLTVPNEVLSNRVEDETVLLNLRTGVYFGLDATGTRFFELLRTTGDLTAVQQTMSEEFDVQVEKLKADLLSLAQELLAKGLLVADSV